MLFVSESVCQFVSLVFPPSLLPSIFSCTNSLSLIRCHSCNSYINPPLALPLIILEVGGEYWTVTYPRIDMTVEKAQRILCVFFCFFLFDVCVCVCVRMCLQRGGRGGSSLSRMMMSKKSLISPWLIFLCILHSLTHSPAARWCAIFTHSNRSESSGDISAVEICVSRIHNTIMPRTHWFVFNAARMWLTRRERQRNSARGRRCIFWHLR